MYARNHVKRSKEVYHGGRERYRRKQEYFTRERKFTYDDILMYMITRKGVSNQMEVLDYCEQKGNGVEMTATALRKQRMKLEPEIFLYVNEEYVQDMYRDNEIKTYHGKLLVAIDGSDILLPTTKELKEEYGYTKGKEGDKETAMASLSCAYDVLNHMFLDGSLRRYRTSERTMAKEHIEKVEEYIKKEKIYIMDRGYFSFEMLSRMEKKGINYVFRLKRGDLTKEKEKMRSEDEEIEIEYTRSRIGTQRDEETKKYMEEVKKTKVRISRIELTSQEEEYLLSNLWKEEYEKEELEEIYGKRWEEETGYRILKNQLQMEKFSGKKGILIAQEVYAAILLSNMMEDIRKEAEEKIEKERYQYEVRINRNMEVGILKREMMELMIGEGGEEKWDMFYERLRKYVIPIRRGRHEERKKEKKPRKYHQNQKRSF